LATKRSKQKMPVSTRITPLIRHMGNLGLCLWDRSTSLCKVWGFLAIGALGGYLHVAVFTWIQRQVPPATLGRAMSIFMFIFIGIRPVSAALTGWLIHRLSLSQLFAGSSAMLIMIVAIALLVSPIRQMRNAGKAI
jgi:small-conductance mechanosensitive channel